MEGRIPLVSVAIPSFNARKTIGLCLKSVREQTYPNIEILLVDSRSTDGTREIAREYGARIIDCEGKLLAARYIGAREARGEYVLLLDTDQVLKPKAVERAVELMKDYDMLVLEEESFNTEWLIPRLYSASKKIINSKYEDPGYSFDPVRGGNPARFFKRDLLLRAFDAIMKTLPREEFMTTIHFDHDIIYYECYRLSRKVGLLKDAVYHIEPDFRKLWRTNIRYGASLRVVEQSSYWEKFLRERNGTFYFGRPIREGILALLLSLILKGVQKIGYCLGPERVEKLLRR